MVRALALLAKDAALELAAELERLEVELRRASVRVRMDGPIEATSSS
jgi:hypothetical protein